MSGAPEGARAYRILYWATGPDGKPVEVSGSWLGASEAGGMSVRPSRAPLRVKLASEHAEFDGRLDVEEVHLLGLEPVEQARRLFRRDGDLHLDRLVGEFEEMRRMHAPSAREALAARAQARAAQTQFADELEQPLAHLFAFVPAILTA